MLTDDVIYMNKSKEVSFGLWASAFANDVKSKSIDYSEINVIVDLPRSFTMQAKSAMALRVFHTYVFQDIHFGEFFFCVKHEESAMSLR